MYYNNGVTESFRVLDKGIRTDSNGKPYNYITLIFLNSPYPAGCSTNGDMLGTWDSKTKEHVWYQSLSERQRNAIVTETITADAAPGITSEPDCSPVSQSGIKFYPLSATEVQKYTNELFKAPFDSQFWTRTKCRNDVHSHIHGNYDYIKYNCYKYQYYVTASGVLSYEHSASCTYGAYGTGESLSYTSCAIMPAFTINIDEWNKI